MKLSDICFVCQTPKFFLLFWKIVKFKCCVACVQTPPPLSKKKNGEWGPFPDFVLREGSVCTRAKCRVISEKGTSWAGCFRTFTTFIIFLYVFTCVNIYFKNQQQQLTKRKRHCDKDSFEGNKIDISIIASVAVVSVSVNRSGRNMTREERTKTPFFAVLYSRVWFLLGFEGNRNYCYAG